MAAWSRSSARSEFEALLHALDIALKRQAALLLLKCGANAIAHRGKERENIAGLSFAQYRGQAHDAFSEGRLIPAHARHAMVELRLLLHQLVEVLKHGEHGADFLRLRPLHLPGKPCAGKRLIPFPAPGRHRSLRGRKDGPPLFERLRGTLELRHGIPVGRGCGLRAGGDKFRHREQGVEPLRQRIGDPEPRQLRPKAADRRLLFGDRPVALLQRGAQFPAQFERGCAGRKPSLELRQPRYARQARSACGGADLGAQPLPLLLRGFPLRVQRLQAGAPLGDGKRQAAYLGHALRLGKPKRRDCIMLVQCGLECGRRLLAENGTMPLPGCIAAPPQFANGRVIHDAAIGRNGGKARLVSGLALAFIGDPVGEAQAPLRLGVVLGPPRFHDGRCRSGKRGQIVDRTGEGPQFIQSVANRRLEPVDLSCRRLLAQQAIALPEEMHAFGEERRVGRPLLQPGDFALGVAVVPFGGFRLLARRRKPLRKACMPAHQILQADGARRRQQERGEIGIARLAEADEAGIDLGGRLRKFLQTRRHVAVGRQIAGFEGGFTQSPEPFRDRERLLVPR